MRGSFLRQRARLSAVVLVAALAAGCARKPDDAAIVANIKSQLYSDPDLRNSDLQVTASGGQITLHGTVPSDAAHLAVYKLATQASGVIKVNDQITVAAVGNAATPVLEPTPTRQPAPKPARERPRKSRHKRSTPPQPRQTAQDVPVDTPAASQAATPLPAAAQPVAQPIAQPAAQPPPLPPPPRPQPREVEIPASSTVTIRMIDGVDSSVNHPGEIFHASLDYPIFVNNELVVPQGADVYVRLVSASSAGHLSGKSELHLELVKLEFQGRSYPLVSSTYSVSGSSRGADTAKKVGGGAILGAIIGGIAGGGKGAAIGATVGGGGGAVYNGVTRGKQVKIPSETKLDFQLEASVVVTVMPRSPAPGV
jgi:BON domain